MIASPLLPKTDEQLRNEETRKMSQIAPPVSSFGLTDEVGYSGLRAFSGRIDDSTLRNLRGSRRAERLRTMAETDDIVGGILLAYETLGKSAPWRVEQGESDELQADFLTTCIDDMNRDWPDILSSAFTMQPYGFAPHEIVYKRRLGADPGKELAPSKFDDGRIGWAKWALRAQTTIPRWFFDDNGEVQGMWQRVVNTDVRRKAGGVSIIGAEVYIPIEKLLLFRTTGQKNSPEGRSVMEAAFKQWFIKNHVQELEAIGAERDLVGYPIITAAPGLEIWGDGPKEKAAFAMAMELATGMRRDELMGAVFPHGWTVELVRSGGPQQVDLDKLIKSKNMGIAISMLADFILIGHEGTGSFALRDSADNFFVRALNGVLDILSGAMNRQAVPRLLRLNGFSAPHPQIVHGDADAPDLENMLKAVKELREGGAEVSQAAEIQRAILERARLPIPEELGEPVLGRETRWSPGARTGGARDRRQFYDGLPLGSQGPRTVHTRGVSRREFLGVAS